MKPLKKMNVSTSAEARHKDLAHYGIIAAAVDELGIVSMLNKLIPPAENQIISTGEAIAAIIINFLSTGDQQRLYITSSFFNTVAVEHLFRPGITAKDFNDDTLGRSLDRISKLGSSMVYSTIMVAAAEKLNLMGKYVHMDTTSISTYGEYGGTEDVKSPKLINTQDNVFSVKENNIIWEGKKSENTEASWEFSEPYEEDIELNITHGYSK